MESEARYTIVGIFVVAVTIFTAAFVMWLSRISGSGEYQHYTVYFRGQSLEGLQKDSSVTMRGIRVGSVESFVIAPDNIEQVKVTLRLETSTPVKSDTYAVMKRNLLTGLAWIDLVGSSQQAALLRETLPGEDYPVIPEGISELEAVAKSLPELISQAAEVLKRIREVLAEENIQAVHDSLANVNRFTAMLAKEDGSLQQTLGSVERAADEVQRLSHSLNSIVKRGDKDIDQLLANASSSIDELAELIVTIKKEMTDLSASLRGSSQVIVQDVGSIAQSMAQAARAFSATAEQLSDLKNVVGGPSEKSLGPGEKVPQ